jgi:hypothetical protein
MQNREVRFTAQMTYADFEELAYHLAGIPKLAGWRAALLDAITVATVLWFAIPRISPLRHDGGLAELLGGVPREQNLWIAVVPTTIIAIQCYSRRIWHSALSLGRRPSKLTWQILRSLQLLILLTVVVPNLAVPWNPVPGQVVAAALLPWSVYSGVAAFLNRRARLLKKSFDANPSASRRCAWVVDDGGISKGDGEIFTRYAWSHFTRFEESQNLILLHTVDARPLALPKRGVDPEILARTRSMILTHVGNGNFQIKASGFDVLPAVSAQPAG